MATFVSGAINVTFQSDSDKFSEKREARVAVQEIPGGDNFTVDLAGRRPLTWQVGLVLANETVWGQLNSVIGASGTLTIETVDPHTAVLMSLGRSASTVDGRSQASAEFLIIDA